MQALVIQRHQPANSYQHPHFFIQSIGYNAGRPSAKAYNNSYVIITEDEVQKGILFWVCFGLWKTNQFAPHINPQKGYELNANAASELIDKTCGKLLLHPDDFLVNVKELKQLIHNEQLLEAQLKIIKQLKKGFARRMLG